MRYNYLSCKVYRVLVFSDEAHKDRKPPYNIEDEDYLLDSIAVSNEQNHEDCDQGGNLLIDNWQRCGLPLVERYRAGARNELCQDVRLFPLLPRGSRIDYLLSVLYAQPHTLSALK